MRKCWSKNHKKSSIRTKANVEEASPDSCFKQFNNVVSIRLRFYYIRGVVGLALGAQNVMNFVKAFTAGCPCPLEFCSGPMQLKEGCIRNTHLSESVIRCKV